MQNLIVQLPLIEEVSPIIQARVTFPITPVFDGAKIDPLREPGLDDLQDFCLDGKPPVNSKKSLKSRSRRYQTYYIADHQLENIIEAGYSSESEEGQMGESENLEIQQINQEQDSYQESEENQSGLDVRFSNYEFRSPEWQISNPKKQLFSKIKSIVTEVETVGFDEKFLKVKQVISRYICEYEQYYCDQSIDLIRKNHFELNEIIEIILKGIDQTFRKIIGGLSFEKRRVKLLRYLDKKKRRVWKKKVNYDCRKKVADKRLRIKGKFVTMEQACEQLGRSDLSGHSLPEIKQMLESKMQQN